MRFGHIALSVSNLTRSVGFYRRHFGLKLVKKYVHDNVVIALLKKDDIVLEIFEFKKHRPLPKYRRKLGDDLRTLGVKHFSVEAPDILKTYQTFKKARVPLAADLRVFDNGARYFFVKDPDGILVEIMERL